jgi:D-methionine transport system permease protein
MADVLLALIPNVTSRIPELIASLWQTLFMLIVPGLISFLVGIVLAFVLIVTRKGDILENLIIWTVLDKVINFFRSVPFIILIALLIPVTRAIAGTAIGVKGAIVPLVVGATPFLPARWKAPYRKLTGVP